MVKITGYKKIEKDDGDEFIVLILKGGVEPVRSEASGRIYFTERKATVLATLDEETCHDLIGTKIEGSIKKVESEPYTYTRDDGEVVHMDYRYEYIPYSEELAEHLVDADEVN